MPTENLTRELIRIISETNGVTLQNTLELMALGPENSAKPYVEEFQRLLFDFQQGNCEINALLKHPMGEAFFYFFKSFPLTYHEEHIHLSGSLSPSFIFTRLQKLLSGPKQELYRQKIEQVYGADSLPIESPADVQRLIALKEGESFDQYLNILYLAKLVLTDRLAHQEAAYHMASELYYKYNIGAIRLKFTLSRLSNIEQEQIPGVDQVSPEDVVMGLYQGFIRFKQEVPGFHFHLSPCFRKEGDFYDSSNFSSKKEHFNHQVEAILELLERYPELKAHLNEVDTVGNEQNLYNKAHFEEMKSGFRKLQFFGFKIRSHHGETWQNLKKGIQAVDNAINIWRINTLEHGLSLGINPNYYLHRLYQKISELNKKGIPLKKGTPEYNEIENLEWYDTAIKEKITAGVPLSDKELTSFLKVKFHTAREIEHYQHDILNQMIDKGISLISLPSSNLKLTRCFPDFKSHPFSWWEKKGVKLGIGTDNYVTLSTNYIREMLILLFSDPDHLKITKLLMVASKEKRRPYVSHLLWEMRKKSLGLD